MTKLGTAAFGAGAAAATIAHAQKKIDEGTAKAFHEALGNPKTIAGASIVACVVLGCLRLASLYIEDHQKNQNPTSTLDANNQAELHGIVQTPNQNLTR